MEDKPTVESTESKQGYVNAPDELPDWYVSYLARSYEREVTLTEYLDKHVLGREYRFLTRRVMHPRSIPLPV